MFGMAISLRMFVALWLLFQTFTNLPFFLFSFTPVPQVQHRFATATSKPGDMAEAKRMFDEIFSDIF